MNGVKKTVSAVLVFGVCSGLLLLIAKNFTNSFDVENQLAQILSIETDLLKEWQQSNGLQQTLRPSSRGLEVELLQRLFSQDTAIYPEKIVTGYYGTLTKNAVARFQKEYDLEQTGVVDTVTRDEINRVFLSHLCPAPVVAYPDYFLKKIDRDALLPQDYVPAGLVDVSTDVKTVGIVCARQDVVRSLVHMFDDAQREEVYLVVTSGYRTTDIQEHLYQYWLELEGEDVLDEIAVPGASEHQLGTAFDFTDRSIRYAGVDTRFGESAGGRWLQANAYKYGFILSYPKDKEEMTGYAYEPWHWRYVGVHLATILHKTKLTLNESPFGI